MSDPIGHECGVALVRTLKPFSYYFQKYNTPLWGFLKLFLLMEKQHNRGQDGAGIGAVKLDVPAGFPLMFRERSSKTNPLDRIFNKIFKNYNEMVQKGVIHPEFEPTVKQNFDYAAEVLLGHLRYGTSGGYALQNCHPYYRKSNWPGKSLMIAGNFNITNNAELNDNLIQRGQHPIFDTDTLTLLEGIGFYLDKHHDMVLRELENTGMTGPSLGEEIGKRLDLCEIFAKASEKWDGAYAIAGVLGSGEAFAIRDPLGIRPFFYFKNDEVIAMASERAPLMTVFDAPIEDVREIEPGAIMVIRKDGSLIEGRFQPPRKRRSCSFERIYFSRGNDRDIYTERKKLGALLSDQILKEIDNDLEHTVFSFIPNTAEVAYFGLMQELRLRRRLEVKNEIISAMKSGTLDEAKVDELILRNWPRAEKSILKDIKLRTFISQEHGRNQLASHVYDITYGTINEGDNLVCIDDSIVRGTTLKNSVIKILSRLNPKKIIIASTAPQIRYPDCYGIDMSQLGKFIAFQAAVDLIKEKGNGRILKEVYQDCLDEVKKTASENTNAVKKIYEGLLEKDISSKISELVTPKIRDWKGEVTIIYQTIENLHRALPGNGGDWYFTGDYPTPGGYKVLNQAYIYYFEQSDLRSY